MSAGAYILKHVKTGRIYVGSSNDVKRREYEHASDLRLNKHRNKPLQEAFNDDSRVVIEKLSTETISEAKKCEQYMLDSCKGLGVLFNVSPDAEVAFKGLQHTEETKQKISSSKMGVGFGVPKSAEHRKNIGLANLGKAGPSETTKAKIVGVRSEKITIDGVVFSSIAEASRKLGIPSSTIFGRINSDSDKFSQWNYS